MVFWARGLGEKKKKHFSFFEANNFATETNSKPVEIYFFDNQHFRQKNPAMVVIICAVREWTYNCFQTVVVALRP